MRITGLVRKGNKVKIAFDDDSFVMVSYEVAVHSGLRKDDELTEKNKEDLIRRNELFEIKNSAFRFLSRRLHSSSELRLKLIQKKFRKELIDEIIDFLLEKEYLNDTEFADKYTHEKISFKKIGVTKIRSELIKKGIERETIDSVLNKYSNDPQLFDNALLLASKKRDFYSRRNLNNQQIKQKLFQFLKGKGFQTDLILKVFEKFELNQYD
ncbi:regulatory protein RecX [Bacteroidota bacterium]